MVMGLIFSLNRKCFRAIKCARMLLNVNAAESSGDCWQILWSQWVNMDDFPPGYPAGIAMRVVLFGPMCFQRATSPCLFLGGSTWVDCL